MRQTLPREEEPECGGVRKSDDWARWEFSGAMCKFLFGSHEVSVA